MAESLRRWLKEQGLQPVCIVLEDGRAILFVQPVEDGTDRPEGRRIPVVEGPGRDVRQPKLPGFGGDR